MTQVGQLLCIAAILTFRFVVMARWAPMVALLLFFSIAAQRLSKLAPVTVWPPV